ncbi:hypothetical protein [Rhodoferax sp.]|nr:hypothetical protein [Rhodoferax sp.]MDD4941942.1 hypothetical protein [Rhodoferax sp.]MDD5480023.1 hypothetical protein [Rhodoferax sp.]
MPQHDGLQLGCRKTQALSHLGELHALRDNLLIQLALLIRECHHTAGA